MERYRPWRVSAISHSEQRGKEGRGRMRSRDMMLASYEYDDSNTIGI